MQSVSHFSIISIKLQYLCENFDNFQLTRQVQLINKLCWFPATAQHQLIIDKGLFFYRVIIDLPDFFSCIKSRVSWPCFRNLCVNLLVLHGQEA